MFVAGPNKGTAPLVQEFGGYARRARPHSVPLTPAAPRILRQSAPLCASSHPSPDAMRSTAPGPGAEAIQTTAHACVLPAPALWSQSIVPSPTNVYAHLKPKATPQAQGSDTSLAYHNAAVSDTQKAGVPGFWNLPAPAISCPPDISGAPSGRYGACTSLCATSTESLLSSPDCAAGSQPYSDTHPPMRVPQNAGPADDICKAKPSQQAWPVAESALDRHASACMRHSRRFAAQQISCPSKECTCCSADEGGGYDSEGYADLMPGHVPNMAPVILHTSSRKAGRQAEPHEARSALVTQTPVVEGHDLGPLVLSAQRQRQRSASASGLNVRPLVTSIAISRSAQSVGRGRGCAVCEGAPMHSSETVAAEGPDSRGLGRACASNMGRSHPGKAASTVDACKLVVMDELTRTPRRWSLADSSV
jgi:hypothetical protein